MSKNTLEEVAAKEHRTASGHVRVRLDHDGNWYTLSASRETHGLRWGFLPVARHTVIWQQVAADQASAERLFEHAVELFV